MALPPDRMKPAADPADPPPFQASPLAGEAPKDLGFGSVVAAESRVRLMNRDGSFNVLRGSRIGSVLGAPYHFLLTIDWLPFLGVLATAYLAMGSLFALAYYVAGPDTLRETDTAFRSGGFLQAFFFSVQTFATIGFGAILPASKLGNAIVLVESFASLSSIGLATGIIFARFSRPIPRIRFSRYAIVAPYRGGTGFMFRIVNAGRNEITSVEASVTLARFEMVSGVRTRVFTQLALERTSVIFFSLSWTIVHPIDETSPLWGVTPEELIRSEAEFLILLSGIDETFFQTVTARGSYTAAEIQWGRRFANIFLSPTPRGVVRIDLRRLDNVEVARLPSVDGKGKDASAVPARR
jgi:inward rectifier potassium channel